MVAIGGLVFFAGGAVTVAAAVYMYREQRRKLAAWSHAEGKVSRRINTETASGYPDHSYLVAFATESGDPIECEPSRAGKLRVGDAVQLIYNPKRPNDAEVAGGYSGVIEAVGLGFFGLLFACVGVFLTWKGLR